MKLVAALSSLLLSGAVSAQDQQQSKPFHLVIKSDDKSVDGQKLAACHVGAAIETLCISGDAGAQFFFNTTKNAVSPIKGYEPAGSLIYNLPVGGQDTPVSEPMVFHTDPATNVAMANFEPDYSGQFVTFDKDGELALFSYMNDAVTPPSTKPRALKNWYVCETNYVSYQYQTLNWVHGNAKAKPQNPSCVKVDVHRKFK